MSDIVKCAFDVGIQDPWPYGIGPRQSEDFFDRIMTSPARAKPVTDPFEPCFPERFEGVFHHGLYTSIDDSGNAKRSFAFSLGDVDSTNRMDTVQFKLAQLIAEPTSLFWCENQHLIHTGRVLSLVHLGDPTNAFEHVRPTPQHQSLKRSHTFAIAFS